MVPEHVPEMTARSLIQAVEDEVMTSPTSVYYLVCLYTDVGRILPDVNDCFGICKDAYGIKDSPTRGWRAVGLKRRRISTKDSH